MIRYKKVDWRGYVNSSFWNLNYGDNAGSLAGEIDNPGKTFPKSLFWAVILVVLPYLIPLLAGISALRSSPSEWSDGYFAEIGMSIGGVWLKLWIQAAAAMANMRMFEAEMCSDAYQLLGMSEMGMLPTAFASKSIFLNVKSSSLVP